jgi:uncharacterized protein YegJ (DUF2314 family)
MTLPRTSRLARELKMKNVIDSVSKLHDHLFLLKIVKNRNVTLWSICHNLKNMKGLMNKVEKRDISDAQAVSNKNVYCAFTIPTVAC